jgi:hypothetical protein
MNPQIRSGLSRVLDGVGRMATFELALRDGHRQISSDYPLVRENLAVIATEMRNTLQAIAMSASLVTHLRSVITDDPQILNDSAQFAACIDEHARHVVQLEYQLAKLRGHCHVIRDHALAIEAKIPSGIGSVARFLSIHSRVSEADIADALASIYQDEMDFYDDIYGLQSTLDVVFASLDGDGRAASGQLDVGVVDRLVGVYGDAFAKLESRANFAGLELQELVTELT